MVEEFGVLWRYVLSKENMGLLSHARTVTDSTEEAVPTAQYMFKTHWGTYQKIIAPEFYRLCEKHGLQMRMSGYMDAMLAGLPSGRAHPDTWSPITIVVTPRGGTHP
jgi:hypothetical protein